MGKAPVDFQMLQFESPSVPETWGFVQDLRREEVISLVVDALRYEQNSIKMLAVRLLDELGEIVSEAVPIIAALLFDDNEQTRMAAALALGRIGEKSVSYLIDARDSEHEIGRFWAVWSLSLIDASYLNCAALGLLESVCDNPRSTLEQMAAEEALDKVMQLVSNKNRAKVFAKNRYIW